MARSGGEGNTDHAGDSARDPALAAGSRGQSSFVTGERADGVAKKAGSVLR